MVLQQQPLLISGAMVRGSEREEDKVGWLFFLRALSSNFGESEAREGKGDAYASEQRGG